MVDITNCENLWEIFVKCKREKRLSDPNILPHFQTWNQTKNGGQFSDEKLKQELESISFIKKNGSKTKIIHSRVADYLMSIFRLVTFQDTLEILIYKDGVFSKSIAKKTIDGECQELLKKHGLSRNAMFEIYAHIKRSTQQPREAFDANKEIINLQNGLLNWKTNKFIAHSKQIPRKEYLSTRQLPVKYDPTAQSPAIETFLSQVLSPEDIVVAKEAIGYCLYNDYHIQRAILCVGEGSNGKSTLLHLIETFLGDDNTRGITLQQLNERPFVIGRLYRAMANISADLPPKKLRDTAVFKALTGGDKVFADVKGKEGFEFRNTAKMFFSCNKVPKSLDDSIAFYRRWILLNFPNYFTESQRDKYLLNKLTDPADLSGLLNIAVKHLNSLLINGDFSNVLSDKEIRERYIDLAEPALAFVREILNRPDATGATLSAFKVSRKDAYDACVRYCQVRNIPKPSRQDLYSAIRNHFGFTSANDKNLYLPNGARGWGWEGITINTVTLDEIQRAHQ